MSSTQSATQYILTHPYHFISKQYTIKKVPKGYRVVKMLYAAICGSDLQYYRGEKSSDKLKSRLPLIPLHEGVCCDMITHKRFIPLAGDFRNVPKEYITKPNIWPELPYFGATMQGLAQTCFMYPESLLIPVPDDVPDDIACLTEPLSIAFQIMRTLQVSHRDSVGIIGTGGIASLIALVFRFAAKISSSNITIYGVRDESLASFTGLVQTVNYHKAENDMSCRHDLVIEAVGGKQMHLTMATALRMVKPGGTIGIVGISDDPLPIRFDQIVNRQIRLQGITRSIPDDYHTALNLFRQRNIQHLIREYIVTQTLQVQSLLDMKKAFESANNNHKAGRTLIQFMLEKPGET